MKYFFFLVLALLLLSSCKTTRYLSVVDGSKSDGTLIMAHNSYGIETSIVQWDDALAKARKSCQEWGYEDAEFFGGSWNECTAYNEYGCTARIVYYKCQCTGSTQSKQIVITDTVNVKQAIPANSEPVKKSKAESLRELKELLDEGILTQEEFEKEKIKILKED
jgi:hypothetical protein